MKFKYLAIPLIPFISTVATAACGGPLPTLTDRVETLEASLSDLTARIESIEEAFSHLQPNAYTHPVILDANDNFIGSFMDSANILVRFEGSSGAYRMSINPSTGQLYPQAATLYADFSCGMDGAEPYLPAPSPNFSDNYLWQDLGAAPNGGYFIPMEGAAVENIIWNSSWSGETGECYVDGRSLQRSVLPVTAVDLSVEYPIRLELR